MLVDGWALLTQSLVAGFHTVTQAFLQSPDGTDDHRRAGARDTDARRLRSASAWLVSVLQAVTQIQEMTLTFIPKVFAVGLSDGACSGPWMLDTMLAFTVEGLQAIPAMTASLR